MNSWVVAILLHQGSFIADYIDIEVILHGRLPPDKTIHSIKHLTTRQGVPMHNQMLHEIRNTLKLRRATSF